MKTLFIVDPQNDFINGSLPVEGGENSMNKLSHDITSLGYNNIIVTLDWHPRRHASFKEWPVHCVQHTVGAAVYAPLMDELYKIDNLTFLTKGNFEKDEYSIFQNSISKDKAIEALLNNDEIHVCGLAGDVCVLNTLSDMLKYIPSNKIKILSQYIASLDNGIKLKKFANENDIEII